MHNTKPTAMAQIWQYAWIYQSYDPRGAVSNQQTRQYILDPVN